MSSEIPEDLHKEGTYSLYVAPQEYLIVSRLDETSSMSCCRINCTFTKRTDTTDRLVAFEYAFWGYIYGCLGTLELPSGNYLVVISKARLVGNLLGHDLFQIRDVLLLPLSIEEDPDWCLCPNKKYWETSGDVVSNVSSSSNTLNDSPGTPKKFNVKSLKSSLASSFELFKSKTGIGSNNSSLEKKTLVKSTGKINEVEEKLLLEFRKVFTTGDFYYSVTGDLSLSYLRKAQLSEEELKKDAWERACDAYFWNKSMCMGMCQKGLADFVITIIQGYIGMSTISVDKEHEYTFAVISRRSRHRCGTRYRTRGIDEKGHCANSVETEQLVSFKNHITSFVLTRGSVPIFWSQEGLKYRPKPKVEREKYSQEEFFDAFSLHVENQFHKYRRQVMINLLDHNNDEDSLSRCFEEQIKLFNSSDISYFPFDFHEQCKGMKYENIQLLINELKEELENMSYTWISSDGLLVQSQSGVCRVNCMDCLDRTNVVQSAIAKYVYTIQLMRFGMISPEEGLPKAIVDDYNNIWANNGDAISRQYAGTSALKGDFTRTGKRKLQGLAKDGLNSLTRYYQSSFRDEYRQIIIDLLLGKVTAEQVIQKYSKKEDKEDISYLDIPAAQGDDMRNSSVSDVSDASDHDAGSDDETGKLVRRASVNVDKPWNIKHKRTFEEICELSQNTIVDHSNYFISSHAVVSLNISGLAGDAALIIASDRYNLVQYEYKSGALLCDDVVLMSNITCIEIGEMVDGHIERHDDDFHRVYAMRIYFKVGEGTEHLAVSDCLGRTTSRRRTSTGGRVFDNMVACHTLRHTKVKKYSEGKAHLEEIMKELMSLQESSAIINFRVSRQCIYSNIGLNVKSAKSDVSCLDENDSTEASLADMIGEKFNKLMDNLSSDDAFRRSKSASQL